MNRIIFGALLAVLAVVEVAPPAHAGIWDTIKKKARAAATSVKRSARKLGTSLRKSRLGRNLLTSGRNLVGAFKKNLSRLARRFFRGGPPKQGTALVVCIENSNSNPLMDKALETVAGLQMRGFAARYQKSAILKNCSQASLVGALRRFKGLRTDVATLVHGDKYSIVLNNSDVMYDSGIEYLKYERLNLGVVFQLNCWGSRLSKYWLRAGAKAVTGTRKSNVRVQAYIPFFRAWTRGKTFREAVRAANTQSNLIQRVNTVYEGPLKKLAAVCCGAKAAGTMCGKIGPKKVRGAFCEHYARTTADVDSTFLVEGDGEARF